MSQAPKEQLESDVRASMKSQDRERLLTLRLLLTELNNKSIATGSPVDEPAFFALVQRAIKQRHESAEMYDKGDRAELADKERREISILEDYLPQQADEDEIRGQIAAFIAEQGLEGPGAMGSVMKEMMPRLSGAADGATVSRLANELLRGKP